MVKNNTKCVIWDWNGTLLDDVQLTYEIAVEMLEERGLKSMGPIETYRKLFRFPVIENYIDMGYDFEKESYQSVADEFGRLYYSRVGKCCSLHEGAVDILHYVLDKGLNQVMLSATGQENLDTQVRAFGVYDLFSEVMGQKDDLGTSKAERGKQWFESKGYQPEEVLFIGDTDHDFEVASQVGCRCILCDGGNQAREVLERCGVPVIHQLEEIKNYL